MIFDWSVMKDYFLYLQSLLINAAHGCNSMMCGTVYCVARGNFFGRRLSQSIEESGLF